jgi:mono/diheme cytochrome c family protein
MTDIVIHRACNDTASGGFADMLGASRVAIARETRQTLNDLPDNLLKDFGIVREEIPYLSGVLIPDSCDTAPAWFGSEMGKPGAASGRMTNSIVVFGLTMLLFMSMLIVASTTVLAQSASVERGRYLVTLGGCNDCHTPGYFFGKPDMTRFLGGSEVGFEVPGLGVFHGPNLTPDHDTGLGAWSAADIATAITTGRRPDGRILAPIMPWHAFASLTGEDVRAIVSYLKSLPPVQNKVPGPFGPAEQPSSFVMKIVAPQAATTGGASLR